MIVHLLHSYFTHINSLVKLNVDVKSKFHITHNSNHQMEQGTEQNEMIKLMIMICMHSSTIK